MLLKNKALIVALVVLAVGLPGLAAAQFPSWQVPAGGETWTAGSSHTLCWSGGTATVFGLGAYDANTNAFYPIAANFPNTGYIAWNLPANLPPGTYYLTIGFNLLNPPTTNSQTFTVRAAPECLSGCFQSGAGLSTANPYIGAPPIVYCGWTQHDAGAFAQAAVVAQLQSQCGEGYELDQGSVVVDVTALPTGVCYAGYGGPYLAEAYAFGCCCPVAVPSETESWGGLKSRYR